jgi:hypothetical protein
MKSRSPFFLLAIATVACVLVPNIPRRIRAQGPQTRQLQQTAPVSSWPSKAKRWALVIGVDQYADPQISPLKGAANDAKTLADALIRHAGFPQDQVILLATDQPAERQPTRLNILRRLSNLASLVPKDGLLLISFAGHGIERGGQAYLVPSDAQLSDDISFLEESAVSVSRMHDRIRATGVAQVVILLDACRNDPGGRADAPNPLTQAYINAFNFDIQNREVQAFVTLYATAVGQRAYEYTEKKQGYFTWAVVEALKGGAANEKGEVTLANLVKYVQENVPKRVAIDLGSGKQQRPFFQMEGYKAEDLVIAVGGATASITSSAPATSSDPVAFELSYWETIKNSNSAEDFKAYLEKYPEGQFVALAKNKITSLEASAKSEPKSSNDSSATELAFWDAIKNSTRAEDFQAYLKKYPDGAFVELAKNRVTQLEATTRDADQRAAAQRQADEIAKRVETFQGTFGAKTFLFNVFANGMLIVSANKISFACDQNKSCSLCGDVCKDSGEIACSQFASASIDGSAIRQIASGRSHAHNVNNYRFNAASPAEAARALAAVREVCKLTPRTLRPK